MSLLRYVLGPLTPLYGLVVRARNKAFDAHPERAARAGVPVVSIGNLSTGGTGKTPVTAFLAEALERDFGATCVISRGYGGKRLIDPMTVDPERSRPRETGDEPLLLARRLGAHRVFVARSREAGALLARTERPDTACLILDDGFQHRALHRDLDLLLLDGLRLWGNGHLLPLGDLREPQAGARRAHALVVTRADRVRDRSAVEAWWAKHGSGGPIFWVGFKLSRLRRWNGGDILDLPESDPPPALAWCALGNPGAFFADLLVAGVPWVETRSFRDHHAVSLREFLLLQEAAQEAGAQRLVCTTKDAVKLTEGHALFEGLPLWIAEQEVTGGEALRDFVLERLRELKEK